MSTYETAILVSDDEGLSDSDLIGMMDLDENDDDDSTIACDSERQVREAEATAALAELAADELYRSCERMSLALTAATNHHENMKRKLSIAENAMDDETHKRYKIDVRMQMHDLETEDDERNRRDNYFFF